MKAGRIATLVASALVAAAFAAGPAFAREDPTNGVRGADVPTMVVTPVSELEPRAGRDGFDWSDAAIGAVAALGAAALGAGSLRLMRARPEEQPVASH
jgi:hypothetical protein